MFEAIHNSGKPFFADETWKEFNDPKKEEWYCCPEKCNKVIPIKTHENFLTHPRYGEPKIIWVATHFRNLPEGTSCKYGESPLHSLLKNVVFKLIEHDKEIYYQNVKLDLSNIKLNHNLEKRWEFKSHGDSFHKKYRRADVIVKFDKWHPFLGNGLVIEVQISNIPEREKTEREEDWMNECYSLIWVWGKDIDTTLDEIRNPKFRLELTDPWLVRQNQMMAEQISDGIDKTKEIAKDNLKRVELVSDAFKNHINEILEEINENKFDELFEKLILNKLGSSCANCKHFCPYTNLYKYPKTAYQIAYGGACWYLRNATGTGRPTDTFVFNTCNHFTQRRLENG